MRRAFSARGVLRPLWVMGAAVSLVITSALPSPVHAEDPQGGPNTAVVRCAFIKHLNDDPIRYPGYPGHSHSHDFFGNDRTDAKQSTTTSVMENATVGIDHVHMSGTTATFYLVAGVQHSFIANQQVRVEGVVVSNSKYNDYNATKNQGTWTVLRTPVPSTTSFAATQTGVSGLPDGSGGTAGDAGMSCGHVSDNVELHGYLTYDTAGYWTPSAYVNGSVIIPNEMRIYYLTPTQVPVSSWRISPRTSRS